MEMQYEEQSNLEDRIIAHFDGSLDSPSSKALLDEVMASPEKRALFRAHETLNSVIAAARVPMEAPLETRREIADRIPGLIAFIPGLLGTAETMPILQQATNPFISFFARMSLQTAVSIGAAVALLTTAGIVVKNNLDNSSTPTPKIATIQQASPATSQPSTNYALGNSAMSATTPSAAVSNSLKRNSANIASNTVATKLNVSEAVSQDNVNASQSIAPSKSIANAATNNSDHLLVSNAFDSPRSTAAIAENIPVTHTGILMPTPYEVGEGITIRPYASYGSRMLQLPGINSSGTNAFVSNSVLGVEFEIGDRYAFRVQGGQTGFAQFAYVKTSRSFAGFPIYGSAMSTQTADWATAGISYSFALTQSFPLILSADAGAVFTNTTGLMAIFGASTEIPLTGQLVVRPTLTYDLVGTSVSSPTVTNAIYTNPITQTSMLTGAFGFQLNFMFRP
jgi:hypothetical protein